MAYNPKIRLNAAIGQNLELSISNMTFFMGDCSNLESFTLIEDGVELNFLLRQCTAEISFNAEVVTP